MTTELTIISHIVAAFWTSVILGVLLHSYKGSISESPILIKVGLLIIFSINFGITIFVFTLNPSMIITVFFVVLPVGVCFMLAGKFEREEVDAGIAARMNELRQQYLKKEKW